MTSTPSMRPAVRGLMIDPGDRVLLVKLEFSDWSGWVLPGGGIEPGEDHHSALRRELAEETGVPEAFIGPPLWIRRVVRPMISGHYDGQEETVYLVPCHKFDVRPGMSEDELRSEGMIGYGWWTVAEMQETSDELRPKQLPGLVAEILEHGAPTTPLLIEG